MKAATTAKRNTANRGDEPVPKPLRADSAAARTEERLRDELRRAPRGALRLELGLCLRAQGRNEEAAREFERAARVDDPPVAARALLQLLRMTDFPATVRTLLRRLEVLASPAEHPTIAVDVATAVLNEGDRAHAIRLLERVRDEAPAPAPRGLEDPSHRRARAVAALRLAELRADDPASAQAVDDLLQEAVDANDPGVTPVAALTLAKRREERPAVQGCASDELLRIAWRFDHPSASPEAGKLLVKLYENRGQRLRADELLDALIERGDPEAVEWAKAQRRRDGSKPRREGVELVPQPVPEPAVDAAAEKVSASRRRVKTLVVGHGTGARRLLHELDQHRVEVVGLVDDYTVDQIGSHSVVGTIEDLPKLLTDRKRDVSEVWLAIPTASPGLRHTVGMACAKAGVACKVLPNPFELLPDKNYFMQLRDLRVEETYGHPDERIAIDQITGDAVRGRSVLIVGAGGSIGGELARQVVRGRPRHLALVDRDESALVTLQGELREDRRLQWTFTRIADAAHRGEMEAAMRDHQPDIVFLTHGLNHAHLAEESIVHTARINVLSSWIAAEEAARAGAEQVILVSSDNAAHLRGPFDWTKAVAERAVVGLRYENTRVCAVRLPNVFRTSGSVIKRFEEQLRKGGPVTVTEASATRKYLTVHQAAQWLLRVAAVAEAHAVYAVDAGLEVSILELAKRLIRLRGLEPERDVQITFPGPRPGEKEDSQLLWGRDEQLLATPIPEVVRIAGAELDMERAEPELRHAEALVDATPEDVLGLLQKALDLDEPVVERATALVSHG